MLEMMVDWNLIYLVFHTKHIRVKTREIIFLKNFPNLTHI
jgi:hypothetical protein